MIPSAEDLTKLLSHSEDNLLFALGQQISGGALHARGSHEDIVDRARLWLSEQNSIFAQYICANETARHICESDQTATTLAVASLVASLIQEIVTPASLGIVATLIAQQGVKNLCKSHWSETEG